MFGYLELSSEGPPCENGPLGVLGFGMLSRSLGAWKASVPGFVDSGWPQGPAHAHKVSFMYSCPLCTGLQGGVTGGRRKSYSFPACPSKINASLETTRSVSDGQTQDAHLHTGTSTLHDVPGLRNFMTCMEVGEPN